MLLPPFENHTIKERAQVSPCFSSWPFAFFYFSQRCSFKPTPGERPFPPNPTSLSQQRFSQRERAPTIWGSRVLSHTLSSTFLCVWDHHYGVRVGGLGPGGLADPIRGHQGCRSLCLLVYLFSCYHQHARTSQCRRHFSPLLRYSFLQINNQEKEEPQRNPRIKGWELLKAHKKISLRTLVICFIVQNFISEQHLPGLSLNLS